MSSRAWLAAAAPATIAIYACGAPGASPGAPGGGSAPPVPPELAISAMLPAQCAGPEIVRIERPVASSAPTMGRFSYGFRFRPPMTQGAPVLVFLPGGPGMTSTDQAPSMIPEGWGYLLTDPRGTGCNTLAALPAPDVSSAFFRTEEIAGDVIAAIKDRGLDPYLLYGISWGTELGTFVAHDLETAGGTPPIAVVLEGVLGRAFGADFGGAGWIAQWGMLQSSLRPDVLTELDTSAAPYGLPDDVWGRALMTILDAGPDLDTMLLDALSTSNADSVRSQALGLVKSLGARQLTDPQSVELYRQTVCRELADTSPADDLDVVFSQGQLVRNVAENGTKCAGLHVTTPYDSAQLQFAAKLYDFIGSNDPATEPWQGDYHFEHHQGRATRVITSGGGHESLQLNQAPCAPAVLASIAAGGADLQQVLLSCPHPVHADEK
jgi:hypothetical protein